jgi:hypothetical protein
MWTTIVPRTIAKMVAQSISMTKQVKAWASPKWVSGISKAAAQIRFQLEPSLGNRQSLAAVLAVLEEYGDTL